MLVSFLGRDENFSDAMAGGNLTALGGALNLHRLAPKRGLSYLIAAGFIIAQPITFETFGRVPD